MKFDNVSNPFRQWGGEVAYYLMREGGVAYSLFLQHAIVSAAHRPLAGKFPIASGVSDQGDLMLKIHPPTLMPLPLAVSSELLKLAVLPLVFGQFGSRRRDMISRFGANIYNLASTMVTARYVNRDLLKGAGFELPQPKDYGLNDADKPTRWYCAALCQADHDPGPRLFDKLAGFKEAYSSLPHVFVDDRMSEKTEDGQPAMAHPVKRSGPDPVVAVAQTDHLPEDSVDLYVQKKIERLKEEEEDRVGSNSTGGCGRGWESADATEFFRQVKRKPLMPWFAKLKQLETGRRKDIRTVSKLRPSRRHPQHLGRRKKHSLLVWFGIDTSGSMGKSELELVDAELKGICNRGADILVIHSDSDIKALEPYDPHRGVGTFRGRGGTDFSPFLIALHNEQVENRPGFAVFYTDGYGCIGGYLALLKSHMGAEKYKKFLEKRPTKTPQGVDLLWLLPQGQRSLHDFKKAVPFGNYAVLPTAGGEE